MKTFKPLSFLLLLSLPYFLSSFSKNKGGDILQIYLNGKQVHQQFVHADKSVKTLHLPSFSNTDKIDVMYSHCGASGKSRVLMIRNEKGERVKEFKFADAAGKSSLMSFTRKEVGDLKNSRLYLYYTAKELPEGKLLAVLNWDAGQSLVKQ